MLAAVKGYYDGQQIIVNENDRKNLYAGDELIITILNSGRRENDIRLEKRQKLIDSAAYVMKTERTAEEVDAYIKELRNDDRF